MSQSTRFVPYHWETYQLNKVQNEVIAYTFLENGERCCVRVKGFKPWVYLILPTHRNFSGVQWQSLGVIKKIVNLINYRIKRKDGNLCIKKAEYVEKYNINHYSERPQPMYKLYFTNFYGRTEIQNVFGYKSKQPSALNFKWNKRSRSFIPVFGDHMVEVYNQMLSVTNCTTCAWMEGNLTPVPKDQRISTMKHELSVDFSRKVFSQVPDEIADTLEYHPTVLAFDIETRTPNYKRMPVKYWDEHNIFMISAVSKRSKTDEKPVRKVFLYGDSHDIDLKKLSPEAAKLLGKNADEVEIVRCPDEQTVLVKFFQHVIEVDPDILTGYNIHGYDLPYIEQRMYKYGLEYPQELSRLKLVRPRWNPFSWSSSAHTKVVLDKISMPGRYYVDMYSVAYKDFKNKLPKFNLDTVLKVLLGKNKFSPVTYEDLFKAFDLQDYPRKLINRCVKRWVPEEELSKEEVDQFKDLYQDFTSGYGMVPILHENVDPSVLVNLFELHEKAKDNMYEPVIYSDYDSLACIELFEFLSVSISTKELASISRVNPGDIYSRGEQHRGVALLSNESYHKGYVLVKDLTYVHLHSKGGFVGDMTPGLTKNTICLDFNSLYPNEMITNNICYTTLIAEKDKGKHEVGTYVEIECDEEYEGEHLTTHKFWFTKKKKGLIPELQERLIAERKIMKKKMAEAHGTPMEAVYNARQLGLKVSGNSLYGMATIGETGKLPCKPVGMATAAMGRYHILQSNEMIRNEGGTVIYNDTDSTIYTMPGVTGKDCVLVGKEHEKKFSKIFPGTLYFEFEKAGTFFGFTKKRYIIWKIIDNPKDPHFGELYDMSHKDAFIIRGILLARKDNARLQRDLFGDVLFGVLKERSYQDTLGVIFKTFAKLIKGLIPWDHLLIIKGVGASYKIDTATMKVFKERCEADGTPIKAGEKVDFIVEYHPRKKGEKEKTVGQKACLPKTYVRKQEEGLNPRPCLIYYLDSALRKSVEQVISIAFNQMINKSLEEQKERKIKAALRELDGVTDLTDWEQILQEYLGPKNDELKEMKKRDRQFAKIHNAVRKVNIKYFTSTNLINTEPNHTPLRYFIKCYKNDLKKGNSFDFVKKYVQQVCSQEDAQEINSILDGPQENWELVTLEEDDEPDNF